MKKNWFLAGLLVLISLALATLPAAASPLAQKPTPNTPVEKTPPGKPDDKGEKKGKKEQYKGEMTAKTASSLTLKLKDGSSVVVQIEASTRIKIPTVKNASLAQVEAGAQVVVQAVLDGDKNVARQILVVPGKPSKAHRVGEVTAYKPGPAGSLTIKDNNGAETTFALSAETKILPAERAASLAVGKRVTVIAPRDPSGGVLTAAGVVIQGEGK